MNTYLRLVAQPMQVRFQFRKSRSASSSESGIVQLMLRFPAYPKAIAYGPYSTPIETTRLIWISRRSVRPKEAQREAIYELNRQIRSYQDGLEAAHAELTRQVEREGLQVVIDGPAIIDALKRLQAGGFVPISLREVYQQFYAAKEAVVEPNRKKRKPGQISEGTLKTYPKRWVLIEQFLLFRKTPRLPVQSVSYSVATDLKEWLQRQRQSRRAKPGYDPATIHKVIGLLKMLLKYAKSKEYIKTSPLYDFTTEGGSAANPHPLTKAQMQHLETCELPPVLRYQCDSWLVAAELCFHYADYMELPQMEFVQSEAGTMMIQHDRVKQTGTSLLQTVNVTPRAARLLERYGGPTGLYYTSSAYFSKILKRIAREADLRGKDGELIKLAFGQGRDTGLTSRAIQGANGIQLTRMGGWSSADQAEKYLNLPVEIVDTFARKLPDSD